jgi:isopentenyldiphosphate isomerase/intracellular septation protein A
MIYFRAMTTKLNPLLLADMVPGMVSILFYVLLRNMYSIEIGIYASLLVGLAGFLLFNYFERDFNKFLFLDFVFFGVLAFLSLLSGKEIFIKLKPVLTIGLISLIFLLANYRRKHYVLELSSRYIRSHRLLKNSLVKLGRGLISYLIFLGILAIFVLYASMSLDILTWALLSTLVLYLGTLAFVSYGILHDNSERKILAGNEVVPLVDKNGTIIGRAARGDVHFNPHTKLMHPVVHLHVFNRKGEIYLQKRLDTKEVQPGKWDTSVGGHVNWGETLEQSLNRETREEIGLSSFNPVFRGTYIWQTDVEKELVYMFSTVTENELVYNPDEITEGKFWSIESIKNKIGKGILTPNLEYEFSLLIAK